MATTCRVWTKQLLHALGHSSGMQFGRTFRIIGVSKRIRHRSWQPNTTKTSTGSDINSTAVQAMVCHERLTSTMHGCMQRVLWSMKVSSVTLVVILLTAFADLPPGEKARLKDLHNIAKETSR